MANLLLGAPIYNDVGVLHTPTYAGGSWTAGNPLTNLSDRRLHRVARSSSASERDTRFECDAKTDRPVRAVMVPKHTLSSAGQWRVVGRPSDALFQYVAGEDLTARGGVFSRTGTATFVDRAGVLRTAATGVPRDGHWIGGVRTLLLEGAGENLCIRSEEFDNAAWTLQNGLTVTPNAIIAPDGTTTADLLVGNGLSTGQAAFQPISFTGNGEKAYSVFLKQGTGDTRVQCSLYDGTAAVHRHIVRVTWTAGVPSLSTFGGSGTPFPVEALANGWYRVSFSASGVVAANDNFFFVYTGDGAANAGSVYAWGAQAENRPVPSSYIPTAGATVTRNTDSLYFPYTPTPQALTIYVKGVNRGTARDSSSRPLVALGNSTNASFFVDGEVAGGFTANHQRAGLVTSGPSAATNVGDTVEVRAVLQSTGATFLGQSINGASETTTTPSGTNALATSWSETRVYLNDRGVGAGFFAFSHLVIRAGEQSLATMRTSYVDSGWLDAWAVGDTLETRQGQNLALLYVPASTAPQCRYWSVQVSDPTNATGHVDLARLCLTGGFQPSTNFSEGSSFALESDSTTVYADGGNGIHDSRPLRRVARFASRNVDLTEALAQFLVQQVNLGARGQVVVIPDPDDSPSRMQRRAFLAVPRELSAIEYTQAAYGNYSVGFTEEL